jgi:hypothetical protein
MSAPAPSAAAAAQPAPSAPPDQVEACPQCGTPRTGRFCELDGYDFMTATLHETPPAQPPQPAPAVVGAVQQQAGGAAAPAPVALRKAPAPEEQPAPEPEAPAQAPAPVAAQVIVTADRAYFEVVRAAGGPDAGLIEFPDYCPDRRFTLSGSQLLIGRRSRSRGISPEIDLTGPPEDPGVSHAHALLLPHAAGGWAVVDLGSANGTYVNDPMKPVPVRVPVPVKPGDRIFAGAWTVLVIT